VTVLRAFLIIGLSALVGVVIGGSIGCSLGFLAPGFYRSFFPMAHAADFQPVEIGIGLGLTQGLGLGLLIGCVVVLAVAWSNARQEPVRSREGPNAVPPPSEPLSSGSQAIRPARRPGY
jgi:hypothetical protein